MNRKHFEELVEQALASLPPEFAERLDNVSVVVEDWASPVQLRKVNLKDPHQLLGLYEGIPLTRRPDAYAGALPDRISIFRIPIEEMSRNDDEIRAQVRKTVMHELGHYFGMSENELRDV
ncbi:MAG: metallopeptidase family protein [Thermoleophilia bacterium]